MGAMIFHEPGYRAPLVFHPPENKTLSGGRYELAVASAQVKSALLLAGLYSKKPVTVKEPFLSRDHTERMLAVFNTVVCHNSDGSLTMPTRQKLKGCSLDIPGDISSAAFVLAAAAICPGSEVVVKNVGLNPTRTGIIDVLKDMGADITVYDSNIAQEMEPRGDVLIRYRPLRASGMIQGENVPRLIDEIPVLAVLAAAAKGQTVIKDAGELRVKEADRIKLMVKLLRALGAQVEETEDGMVITGRAREFTAPGVIETAGDHRLAMAAAVAGLRTAGGLTITDEACINVSFPRFAGLLRELGADVKEEAPLC
jgi:3-phosphoshikimate 1-carboxyvinyltransferase